MDPVWIPLIAALGGALIGSAASILTQLVLQRGESKRAHARLAVEAATAEFDARLKHAPQGSPMMPFASFLVHQLRVLEAAAEGELTATKLQEIDKEVEAFAEADRLWRESRKKRVPPSG